MADFQKMYSIMFNAVTDAIESLQKAQQTAEELYLSANQPNVTVWETSDTDDSSEKGP